MALSVNTNVGALQALASASKTNGSLETSMARLASGKRINSAADDAWHGDCFSPYCGNSWN